MQLLDAGSQLASRPTPNATVSPGWANNDVTGASPATIADPDCWNAIMAEVLSVLTAAGIGPSKDSVNQLLQACAQLFGSYAADTGAANAYVVTLAPPLTTHVVGMPIRVKIANINTGASTFNPGPGAVNITTRDGSALIGGELQAGALAEFVYDGTHYQLVATRGRLIGVQVFTASGTYTPTPGMQSIIARVQGGGGGGAGATQPTVGNVSLGGPGTPGTYGEGKFTAAQVGASQPVTIGTGGTGGAGAAGNNGGTSSLGTLISCPGGVGGGMLNNVAAPNAQGNGSESSAASGANIVAELGTAASLSVALSASGAYGGAGGRSAFGDGGRIASLNSAGVNADNYGAGGGGVAINNGGGGSYAGGNAKAGIIIIEEYA